MTVLEKFDGFVEEITEDNIYVRMVSSTGEDLWADIPRENFRVPVEPKEGMLFSMIVSEDGIVYQLPPPRTQIELDEEMICLETFLSGRIVAKTETSEESFYRQCAELLTVVHTYKPFPYYKRTRWNNRTAGNGRYEGHGIVRRFSEKAIHVALYLPKLCGQYKSEEAALAAIKEAVENE